MTTVQERKYLSIMLKKEDRGHLIKFLEDIEGDYVIRDYKQSGHWASRIVIEDEVLWTDLVNNGATPKKSLNLKYPLKNIIPERLERHFLRGYFDGDGCISRYKTEWNLDGHECSVLGTKEFLMEYIKKLPINQNNKMTQRNPGNKTNNWTYRFKGNQQVYNAMHFLYNDSLVYLDRKYQKYVDLAQMISRPI